MFRSFSKPATQVVGLVPLIFCVKYPSRFAMRTARARRIGQRGKKRAYLAQPKGDWGQTRPSLALSWAEQELTCAELGPSLRRTGAECGQHGLARTLIKAKRWK